MKHIILSLVTIIALTIVTVTVCIKLMNNVPYIITHIDSDNYYHARHLENGSTVVFLLSDDRVNDPIRKVGTLVQVKTDKNGENPLVTKWRNEE